MQALSLPELVDPLLLSILTVGAVYLVVLAARLRSPRRWSYSRPIPVAGAGFAFAALAGYQLTGHLVPGLGLAIALLLGAGLVIDLVRVPGILWPLLLAPGAAVIAMASAIPDPLWARIFAAAVTALCGALLCDLDRRCSRRGLSPLLLAATMVGLYESVPDPDFALLLVGSSLPVALLGWPVVLGRLGSPGAAAAVGFLAWADAVGARGRLPAIIGGAACLGLLAVEPLAHLALPGRQSFLEKIGSRWWELPCVVLVQLALAALCSRVSFITQSPLGAGQVIAGSLAVIVVMARLVSAHIA